MAGHVQDRWYKTAKGLDGKPQRVKADRYGQGMRYRARYIAPDGTERSQSFPDKQKRQAEAWLTQMQASITRGDYIDPKAGEISFRRYAEDWRLSQTFDESSHQQGPGVESD